MNHTTRTRQTIEAFGALTILVVLLAGIPAALWTLAGSPLPAGIPTVNELVDTLTNGPIADSTIIKGIAIAGWIAWLQITASILVETIAWIRGATAPKLALTGPIQPAIRGLVASAAMLLATPALAAVPLIVATPPPAHAAMHAPERQTEPVPVTGPTLVSGTPNPSATPPAVQGPSIHVVQHRDTLWGLAEHHLGDPLRWPEIFELNLARTQPDGRRLSDPNLIVIGWQLELPADAIETGTAFDATDPAADTAQVDAVTTPTPDAVTGPAEAATAPNGPVTLQGPTSEAAGFIDAPPPPTPEADQQLSQSEDDSSRDTARRLAPLVGGSLLAASIVALIDKLRRTRIRQHSPAAYAPTDPHLQHAELILRHAADLQGATRLDLALRAFASGLRHSQTFDVTIMAVRVDDDEIEILLDSPLDTAPDGFEMTGDPRGWRLQAGINDDQLRGLADGSTAPLPALVTVGTSDGDPIMIDLETASIVTISGPDEITAAYVERLTTELATSTWADHLDLVTVGEPVGDVSGSQRVHHFTTIREATAHMHAVARGVAAGLAATDKPTTLASRIADDHGDGWIPTILISSSPIDPKDLADLDGEIKPGTGFGIVTPGPELDGAWHICLNDRRLHLTPHGLDLDALTLQPDTAADIDRVLTDLTVDTEPDDNTLDLREGDHPTITVHEPEPFIEASHEIEFRILGSVDVIGIPPLNRRKSLEIAVYLALHLDGVTDDRVKMVFWPDRTPTRQTFNTTMSMTRCGLGTDANNRHYLPYYAEAGQRFTLTAVATTDLDRFEARASRAKNFPGPEARDLLIEALEMVRGQPFDVSRGYEWAFSEGIVTRASLTVANASHQLALMALDDDNYPLVEWAATKGLLASPGDEALYRDRILAAHRAGIPSGPKKIIEELCEVVETNEPYDCLQPETLTLIESLGHTTYQVRRPCEWRQRDTSRPDQE